MEMQDGWGRGARGAGLAFALVLAAPAPWSGAQAAPRITSGPPQLTAQTMARFTFTGGSRGPLRCRLDGGRARRCRRATSYAALAEGAHAFSVSQGRARATYAWRIDLQRPPRPVLTQAPQDLTAATSATFTFSDGEPGVALLCGLDGGALRACGSPVVYDGLADGRHRFAVVATDAAGNVSVAATHGWTVDT